MATVYRVTDLEDDAKATKSTGNRSLAPSSPSVSPSLVEPRLVTAPEPIEVRDAWRQALAEYLERKARTSALRTELAAVRSVAKERRHEQRLARNLKKELS